jgi:hypothetical protein
MDTYGSIDWNSQLNGSGTACGNKSFEETGHDFYIVQDLWVWNVSTGQWDDCNFGPQVWNPGPASHAVTTGFGWYSPPCWDHASLIDGVDAVFYTQRSSIADQFGFGFNIWQFVNTYIEVWACANGNQYC